MERIFDALHRHEVERHDFPELEHCKKFSASDLLPKRIAHPIYHPTMQFHVDIAARDHDSDRSSRTSDLVGEQRRDADSACTFENFSFLLVSMTNAGRDLTLAQQHYVIEQGPTHGNCQLVVQADATAERVGKARKFLHLHWNARIEARASSPRPVPW